MFKITNSKNSIFQGQQKKVMGTKNMRKTKSCVTNEKKFKSVKGLQRNFRKCIHKNSQFFANILILMPKQKNAQSKQCSPMGSLSPLEIFTLKMGHPVY